MERYGQIYREMVSLLKDSRTINPKMFGYGISFSTKMSSLEIMYRTTLKKLKELEEVARKETAEGKILLNGTTRAWNETIAFFEASLNAFYSLLQIIAKITPYFYKEKKSESLRKIGKGFGDNFGKIVEFFKGNTKIDPELSSYLTKELGWYEALRNNRHMITHEGSAFLGFDKDGRIIFLDYPHPKEGFSWFGPKKFRQLEDYLGQSFKDLFDFLEFYVNHFRQRLESSE